MDQISRLLGTVQRLYDPENGCPWDKEQTFSTIAPYILKEIYEVLGAIARKDLDDLRGELGDLLFQAVFYAQVVQGEGRFDSDDIYAAISDKLERRHPYVFADVSTSNSIEVLTRWEKIKSEERVQKAQHSTLDDIPRSLPALIRAREIWKRCSNIGFNWKTLGPIIDKVYGEVGEVMSRVKQAVIDQAKLEEEMGDLLFAAVNMARHLNTRAETVLQKANEKSERRFCGVERIVASHDLGMIDANLETMEKVWQQVKRQEIDLQGIPSVKGDLCGFLNSKRLIYVKSIYPKEVIFSSRYVDEAPYILSLRAIQVATRW